MDIMDDDPSGEPLAEDPLSTIKDISVYDEMLKITTGLKRIYMSGYSVGDEGCELLCRALRENSTVSVLDLSYNKISNIGAKHVADMLKVNTTLDVLYLYRNHLIDEVGFKYITDAIRHNSSVTYMQIIGGRPEYWLACKRNRHNRYQKSVTLMELCL